ncbi:MAG: DUF2905 domain-containing protein [Gammaproteobacteria bacterium]|nr:DUF2905 domain-containing protein [Gammaproteobacteria bacterium]
MQRFLIISGVVLLVLGLIWPVLQKLLYKSNFFRLPGDIVVEQENFRFYFPITSAIIISIIISLIIWFLRR